jgi:hypothetical protein
MYWNLERKSFQFFKYDQPKFGMFIPSPWFQNSREVHQIMKDSCSYIWSLVDKMLVSNEAFKSHDLCRNYLPLKLSLHNQSHIILENKFFAFGGALLL